MVIKVSAIDTKIPGINGLVTKTQYESEKQSFKKKIEGVGEKIPSTSKLIKNTNYYYSWIQNMFG